MTCYEVYCFSGRVLTTIGQLTGEAQVSAKTLSLSDLTNGSGVANLRREIDKNLGVDIVSHFHINISFSLTTPGTNVYLPKNLWLNLTVIKTN